MKKTIYLVLICITALFTFYSCGEDDARDASTISQSEFVRKDISFDEFLKIENNYSSIYQLNDVTSSKCGMTLGFDWEQYSYDQSTNSGIITITVHGYEHYNIFINGIGTIYSKYKTFLS